MGNRLKGKKPLSKRLYLLAFACFFLCSGFSFLGYLAYHTAYGRYLPLAQDGIQHLRRAEALLATLPQNPLDAPTVNQAQHEFAAALTSFAQVNAGLQSLPGLGVKVGTFIPVYGARLHAAVHLVPLAVGISQAGMASCDILNVFIAGFHNPFKTQAHGLTMADLAIIDQDFQRIKGAFHLIVDESSQVQPTDLQFDPHLSELFATLQKDMPLLQQWLDATGKMLAVFPTLLGIGKPTNYLIEVLDSTELRPAGGFIGNYGILTLSGGRVTAAHITDVDLLDKPYTAAGHSIPYPSAYTWFPHYLGAGSWSLSNSNLDADFPMAARYGELNYQREGGKIPVQGVIAITPALISHALEITGPIAIPEYHETVTAQNLIDRIHYHQLGPAGEGPDYVASPDGHSSLRKRFTELLAEHFLAHVRQLAPSALPRFLQLLVSSVRSKDLQIYLNSSVAENLLHQFHLDAAIQSSVGDGLFVVDANLSANKANPFIINTLDDQVTIDAEGNAVHHTTLSYAWTLKGHSYGHAHYRDYVRVYVPPGSMLSMQSGWEPQGTSEAFGREVWAGFFTLTYGQTHTIRLIWTVPDAARKDALGWHYQYVIQRQAGAQWALNLRVTLPSCAAMPHTWGGLVASNKQTATLAQSLNGDMNVGVNYYAC